LLIALAPLPLGAVDSWAWGILAVSVGLLVTAWSLTALISGSGHAPAISLARCSSFAVPFALVAAWSFVQGLAGSPIDWHPQWNPNAASLGLPPDGQTLHDRFEAGSALVKLLLPAGIFWLSLRACRDPGRARLAFLVLSCAGLLYAGYGLVAYFSGLELVLWLEKTSYFGSLTSTFVNRNSFATYAGLVLVVATGLLLTSLEEEVGPEWSLRTRLLGLLTVFLERGWPVILAWVTLASALILTQSRGGLLAAFTGLCALLATFTLRRSSYSSLAVIATAPILAAGIALFAISGEGTDARLAGAEGDIAARTHLYALALEAVAERPVTGWGHGSFPDVFRMMRDAAVQQDVVMAHNSYLEAALELGVPGAALLVLAIAALLLRCLIGAQVRRRDAIYPCIGIGATVLVATHSLVDFSLQIPAVAATYALIMGAAVAQIVVENTPVPMRLLGVSGFAPTGDTTYLLEHFGLTADGLATAVRELAG